MSNEEKLRECAKALLDKIEQVDSHPAYRGVWVLHQQHGGDYKGPGFGDEMAALRKVLQETAPPKPKHPAEVAFSKWWEAVATHQDSREIFLAGYKAGLLAASTMAWDIAYGDLATDIEKAAAGVPIQ